MNEAFVLDASVAIAWYLSEVFSDAARGWQKRMLDGKITFYIPLLHYWEFANVLRTYVRRIEIAPELAHEIFTLHLEAPFQIIEPQRTSILEIAFEYESTAYDAVYISLCIEHDLPLVTAERTTTPWVVKLGKRARILKSNS